ncbi:MAG: hypothetical protein JSS41_01825 [Proteobacteria bacterium]|nr:hypothetical protein [Pseudomonadota bacterium]
MADRLPPSDRPRDRHAGAWWRQGVVWWGIGVFVASLAGCVLLIVVAQRSADPPLPTTGLHVLGMPMQRPPAAASAASPPTRPPANASPASAASASGQ